MYQIPNSENPFVISGIRERTIIGYWSLVADWKEIKEWSDDINDCGTLCKVWDHNTPEKSITLIKSKTDQGYYKDDNGYNWDAAEPIKYDKDMYYAV